MNKQAKHAKQVERTKKSKLLLQRWSAWWRLAPSRLIHCLAYSLLGLALLTAVFGILTLITGNTGSLNRLLDSDIAIFSSVTYHPAVTEEVMFSILKNFYAGIAIFTAVMAIMLTIIIIVGVLIGLSKLGHILVDMVMGGKRQPQCNDVLLVTLVAWSAVIILTWVLLNINTTLQYLIGECVLLTVNLFLMWLTWRLGSSKGNQATAKDKTLSEGE